MAGEGGRSAPLEDGYLDKTSGFSLLLLLLVETEGFLRTFLEGGDGALESLCPLELLSLLVTAVFFLVATAVALS